MTTPSIAHEEQQRLQRLGLTVGRWALQAKPASSMPQLSYARELLVLQHAYGIVQTDRLRWPLPRRGPDAGAEVEPDALHIHDDVELRVLLAGRVRYIVSDGAVPLLLDLAAGDWIVLPAGLPHRLMPLPGDRLDMLRLFSRPEGWRARTVDPALERVA